MKYFLLLSCAIAALPAVASVPASTFEERLFLAKSAESDERFHPYHEQLVRHAGHHFAQTMRSCAAFSRRDSAAFVLVADIAPDGSARDVAVKPAHAAARCFASGFAAIRYLAPPEYPGREGFPVMMRIGGQ